jgi:DNA-binding CsgD family transcriptional regulator
MYAPSLVRLGLPPDADLIYRTLTTFGPHPIAGLSRELGLGQNRINEALVTLQSIGAVSVRRERGRMADRWVAEPPTSFLDKLKRPQPKAVLIDPPIRADRLLELGDGVRFLPSRQAARERLAYLISAARHEHLTINPEPSFELSSVQAAAPTELALDARQVTVRVLGVQSADPDLLQPYGGPIQQSHMLYRQAVTVPMKLMLIDRSVALFPVDPHDYDRGYLELTHPPVVRSLHQTFERHWNESAVPPEITVTNFVLSPRESAIVALLAKGYTDASVAKELRISDRSVSNILRSVMDRLGVENRFQLGLALGNLRAAAPPPGMAQALGSIESGEMS